MAMKPSFLGVAEIDFHPLKMIMTYKKSTDAGASQLRYIFERVMVAARCRLWWRFTGALITKQSKVGRGS